MRAGDVRRSVSGTAAGVRVAVAVAAVASLTVAGSGALSGSFAAVGAAGQAPRTASSSSDGAEGYYTKAQAQRGRAAFNEHCAECHNAGEPIDPEVAAKRAAPNVTGKPISMSGDISRHVGMKFEGKTAYPSVYYLFKRMEDFPPDRRTVAQPMRADIVAYMLQQNGFPPGPVELTPDYEAMKLMPLDEPGFTRLFNGKDLAGFTFVTGEIIGGANGRVIPCRRPGGCVTQPGPNWIVRKGLLVCVCQEHGYFYTEKKYLNFTLRLDYRFARPAEWEGDDYLFGGNSGYYMFIDPVEAKAIALEGKNRQVLWPYGVNTKIKYTEDIAARNRVLKPLGQWNAIEIVSKDGQLKSYLNGTLISTVSEHEFKEPAPIGWQAQGAEIHWRNIRIKEE